MPSNYKVSQRRKKQGKKGKGSGGNRKKNCAQTSAVANKSTMHSAVDRLTKSLGTLPSAPTVPGRAHRPSPEERTYAWTSTEVERFLAEGEWDSDDDAEEYAAQETDGQGEALASVDLAVEVPLREMPPPKPIKSVFGNANAAGAQEDMSAALLGSLLDPNAGGANKNKDGLMGLLSAQQPQATASDDVRERLRARLRQKQRERSRISEDDIVRDKKGKKMKNVKKVTPEDMLYGGPKARNAMVDKNASKKAQQQRLAALRESLQGRLTNDAGEQTISDAEE